MEDDKNKDGKPIPTSEENQNENKDKSVEIDPNAQEDTDFEKELDLLESEENGDKPAPKPKRSELDKAVFTAKSTMKRIKELGGDPSLVLEDEEEPQPKKPEVDTGQFVTKLDLAQQEAEKLAKTPGEVKLIMWYVKNRSMSVSDAHFLANKGKIQKTLSEVNRAREVNPANPNGGPGGRSPDRNNTDVPELSEADRNRLIQSGMVYDSKKKAYVGQKIQHRYDDAAKVWVTEKI